MTISTRALKEARMDEQTAMYQVGNKVRVVQSGFEGVIQEFTAAGVRVRIAENDVRTYALSDLHLASYDQVSVGHSVRHTPDNVEGLVTDVSPVGVTVRLASGEVRTYPAVELMALEPELLAGERVVGSGPLAGRSGEPTGGRAIGTDVLTGQALESDRPADPDTRFTSSPAPILVGRRVRHEPDDVEGLVTDVTAAGVTVRLAENDVRVYPASSLRLV